MEMFGDCTGTCQPVADAAAHYVAGANMNDPRGLNGEYGGLGGFSPVTVWTLAKSGGRVRPQTRARTRVTLVGSF
jgi:hypothetical protein